MSIVQTLRDRLKAHHRGASSDYAKAVVSPDGVKVQNLDAMLAGADRTLDQLESDVVKYARAAALKPMADTLPDRQTEYDAAGLALATFDIETVGELAKRRAVLKVCALSSPGLSAGQAEKELRGIDEYQVQRIRERVKVALAQYKTIRPFNLAKAAAEELQAIREALAVVGVEV